MNIYHNSETNYNDKILKLIIMFKCLILINYTSYVKSVAILQAVIFKSISPLNIDYCKCMNVFFY